MSNTIESKGRSVEEAISEALLRTGWRRDEVDVTVLEQPKSGFLGIFGGKQAKVKVERKGGGERRGRREDARLDAPRSDGRDSRSGGRDRGQRGGRDRDQRSGRTAEARGPEGAGAEPRTEPRADQRGGEGRRDGGRDARGGRDRDQRGGRDRERPRQEAGSRGPTATAEPATDRTPVAGEEGGRGSSRRRRRRPTRQREDGPVETRDVDSLQPTLDVAASETAAPVKEQRPEERQPEPVMVTPEPVAAASNHEDIPAQEPAAFEAPMELSGPVEYSAAALESITPYERPTTLSQAHLLQGVATDLMRHAGFPCRCEVKEGEYDLVKLIVEDRSAQVLVGRYGAAVDAVEHLVEKIASQVAGDRVRMNLDVNNFRRRREEHLVQVARSAVREVRETGEPIHLDPLCARERRIVHLQVMDILGMATYTVQDENGKHVVIATEEHVRAAAAAAGDAHLSQEDDAHADDLHGDHVTGGNADNRA
jgi:spoIIIJ-associated protein